MKMSVSTRMSATIPFVPARYRRCWCCPKGGREREFWIGCFALEVEIEGTANDLRHGYALVLGQDIDALALLLSEVYLRTSY